MYFLFTDETNLNSSRDERFFIYGGLLFHIEKLLELHNGIREIKNEAGYQPGDKFKFHTHSRPENVTPQAHAKAKSSTIDLCMECDCKFISHIILHDIIQNKKRDENIQWAINHVIAKYNKYLDIMDDCGICIVDNLPVDTQFRFLSDKFNYGLDFEDGKRSNLHRIKLFASTSIDSSHVASAMDIVLGAFRYCVNDPKNIDVAKEIIQKVIQMMYIEDEIDYEYRPDGLIVRPEIENIIVDEYKAEYVNLLERIDGLLTSNE